MRMRTIEQAAEYIQKSDPETAITKTALRRLVTTGQLPSVRVGVKYLVSLESLDAYLSSAELPASKAPGSKAAYEEPCC